MTAYVPNSAAVAFTPPQAGRKPDMLIYANNQKENNYMKITVAGKNKEYDDGITVAKLVELENVETPEYVTVTVNDEFVESRDFANTTIKDGDTVEFLYFMGGGC